MKLLTSHQYAAIRCPEDAYSVSPNRLMLDKVDVKDTENVVASKSLVSLAEQNGFLVEEDGLVHVQKIYAEPLASDSRDRLWGGANFLDPDKKIPYNAESFNLLQKTDKKVSIRKLIEFQRARYEDIDKDADLPKNAKVRPVDTVGRKHAHAIQVEENYPKELGGTLWVIMGNAEHSQHVPIFGSITDTVAPYQVPGSQCTPESAYWTMRQVFALSEISRNPYGKYVREYSDLQEKTILKHIDKELGAQLIKAYQISTDTGRQLVTQFSMEYQQKAYDDATLMAKELNTYFLDISGNPDVNGYPDHRTKPHIPSLLGEERQA